LNIAFPADIYSENGVNFPYKGAGTVTAMDYFITVEACHMMHFCINLTKDTTLDQKP
jgi:hypothetical protein